MRFGMAIGGPLQAIGPFAQAIEQSGFDSAWATETSSNPFLQAALAAQATSRVRVGTAIALAFPRSPAIAAMTAADVDELSGGRFALGLGTQVKRVNEQRFSTAFDHPARRMKEYVLAVRAFYGGYFGEEPRFQGEHYTITMAPWPRVVPPVRRTLPILVAAVGPGMLRAAGEVADGVIGHPLTSPRYVAEVVAPAIAAGAKRGGRAPAEVELVQSVMVAIAEDREVARREVSLQLGFYATTPAYQPVLALHGFEGLMGDLRRAYADRDYRRLADLVPEEMAETYALWGTADEVVEKAARFDDLAKEGGVAVSELLLGGPWYRVRPERLLENHMAILEAFGR
ncbi:MAG TPA: TIGR03617 family F420-dependent LLM class oxidoreductase [Actinomycetota bacterium]|nr:TIGR03617 family F420-dependent LLM class oxidoreductase [Actinomycetota bacterium]